MKKVIVVHKGRRFPVTAIVEDMLFLFGNIPWLFRGEKTVEMSSPGRGVFMIDGRVFGVDLTGLDSEQAAHLLVKYRASITSVRWSIEGQLPQLILDALGRLDTSTLLLSLHVEGKQFEQLKVLSDKIVGLVVEEPDRGPTCKGRGIKYLPRMARLRYLNLTRACVRDDDLRRVASFVGLRTLILRERPISSAGLRHLTGLIALRRLNLEYSEVGDEGLRHLAKLKRIVWLNLKDTDVSDTGLSRLLALTRLQWLNLNHTAISVRGFNILEAMPRLKYVSLNAPHTSEYEIAAYRRRAGVRSSAVPTSQRGRSVKTKVLRGEDCRRLAKESYISALDLSNVDGKLDSSCFKHLSRIRSLRSLSLSDRWLSDRDLALISGMKNLRMLNLFGCKMSLRGLAHLAQLPELRKLNLSGVRGAQIRPLAKLTRLRELRLFLFNIRSLKPLANLSELRRLRLQGTPIGDSDLRYLGQLGKLWLLDLSHTRVSHRGLKYLRQLRQLRSLYLEGTTITRSLSSSTGNCLTITDDRCKVKAVTVTDRALQQLSHLPQLMYLRFGNVDISEVGKREIPRMMSLCWVGLGNGSHSSVFHAFSTAMRSASKRLNASCTHSIGRAPQEPSPFNGFDAWID